MNRIKSAAIYLICSLITFGSCSKHPLKGDNSLRTIKVLAVDSGLKIVPAYPVDNNYSTKLDEHSNSNSNEVMYERRTDNDFRDRANRMAFIRKVYTIFSAQMASTVLVTGYIMLHYYDLGYFLMRNYRLLALVGSVGSLSIVYILVSNSKIRHQYPQNLILLGTHTFCQSILVGTFCCLMDNPKAVCLGTVHTLVALVAITLYSFQPNPKYDLTTRSTTLLTSLCALLVALALSSFLNFSLIDNAISAILAVISATYIAYDTQKIVGGVHHKHSYGKREYILAALSLYQDVVNFFFHTVTFISKSSSSSRVEEG